jgi:hypothetical protein
MRDSDRRSGSLVSYVDLESRVRADHPLRAIRAIVNEALVTLRDDFDAIYAATLARHRPRASGCLRALLQVSCRDTIRAPDH